MINERIKQLILLLDLSYAEFAEEIGVQASSISHLVSARNKPSLEFIEKVHRRYPDLEINWLLFGQGYPFLQAKNETLGIPPTLENTQEKQEELAVDPSPFIPISSESSRKENMLNLSSKTTTGDSQAIQKIIILYEDGSFSEFCPKRVP